MVTHIKTSKDRERFKTELECYERLKGVDFLPIFIRSNDETLTIEMEKMIGMQLHSFIKKYGHMPYDFFQQLYGIFQKMLAVGIYDGCDTTKFCDHYYIEDDGRYRMVDYDICEINRHDNPEISKVWASRLRRDYAFVLRNSSSDDQVSSWNDMKYRLQAQGITNDIIEDYFANKKMV